MGYIIVTLIDNSIHYVFTRIGDELRVFSEQQSGDILKCMERNSEVFNQTYILHRSDNEIRGVAKQSATMLTLKTLCEELDDNIIAIRTDDIAKYY